MSSITAIIKKNDVIVFFLLNRKMHCRILNVLMKAVTQLGSAGFVVSLATVCLLYDLAYYSRIGALVVLNLIVSQVIIQLVKRIANRPRPYKTFDWVIAVKPPECKYSFPSGHTSAAFSLAFVLTYTIPAFSLIFIFPAVLVGISRIYLGCHFPTDVIIGFLISYITFICILQIMPLS
ncbi:MAG: phosphatase PAP2 family protein [Clostridia bacterium]|nr:phosphatase PAP2 family protein [Clostridia bacterium]